MNGGQRRSAGPDQPEESLHRLLIDPAAVLGGKVVLTGPNARHVRQVLRLRAGDSVRGLVAEGGKPAGADLLLRLESLSAQAVVCEVRGEVPLPPEPDLAVTVCQGLSRGERFEYVLQKGTEIGAAAFQPVVTERSVVRLEGAGQVKLARWQRIIEEAALQSGRAGVPVVHAPVTLGALCSAYRLAPADLMLVADERETRGLRETLRQQPAGWRPASCAILIGPEGGLARAEVRQLTDAGFAPVSLGPRILRTETAGSVLLALLLYELSALEGTHERG